MVTDRNRADVARMIEQGTAPWLDLCATPNPIVPPGSQAAAKRAADELGPYPWRDQPPPSREPDAQDQAALSNITSSEDRLEVLRLMDVFAWAGPVGKLSILLDTPERLVEPLVQAAHAKGVIAVVDMKKLNATLESAGFAGDQLAFRSLVMDTLYGFYAEVGRPTDVAHTPISFMNDGYVRHIRETGRELNGAGVTLLDSLSAAVAELPMIAPALKAASESMDLFERVIRSRR